MLRNWFAIGVVATLLLSLPMFAADPVAEKKTDEQLKEMALTLNDLTSVDGMNAKLKELGKDKATAKQLVAVAGKMQKDAEEKKSPFKFNAALVLGMLASQVKDFPHAEQFLEFCYESAVKLQSGKRILTAYEPLVEVYWEQKKYKEAEELIKKLIDTDGGQDLEVAKPIVMEQLVRTKVKQGDIDDALAITENMISADKDGWYFVQLKGSVLREVGKFKEAIVAYEDVVERLKKAKLPANKKAREAISQRARYVLSSLYVDIKDVEKAAETLQALIKDDPENSTYYNDLGFIWVDNDMKLDESETMIRKAIELDAALRKKLLDDGKITEEIAKAENSAYLDSLGWVLFKRGKFEEAYKYLDKASQDPEDGNHIEIWDHVADCLVALDKKKEAVDVWTKALKLEDLTKRDAERRKKITEKLKKTKAELAK